MKLLCGVLGVLILSGCATTLPQCVAPNEAIEKADEITNTPCALRLQKKDGKESTYVIIHSTFGYLGEEQR